MSEGFFDNPYGSTILESTPESAFYSAAPFGDTGFSPMAQQYWAGQYGNIQNQYLGELGRAARNQKDGPSFVDFLEDYPFTQRYTAMSPALRPGGSFRRFAPSTRFMYS